MENTSHKGKELNNVQETWNENERLRAEDNAGVPNNEAPIEEATATELDQLIKQEANEYDQENKENRLLGGDRASVNDVEGNE